MKSLQNTQIQNRSFVSLQSVCFSLQSKQINFLLGLLTELHEKRDTKLRGEKGWCRGRQ